MVMPAYNEAERIYRNLLETADQLEKFTDSFRIIAVNDGSTDMTEQEIRRAAEADHRIGVISYPDNRGKGYAVRRGMLASKARYTAFLDADLELPPYLLEDFLKKAEEEQYDVVIGSKMHPDSQLEYPLYRKIMSVGYYLFLRVLFGWKLKDTQTGIKLFRTDRIRPVLKTVKNGRFSFDIDLLARADRAGLKIAEMPVVVNYSRNKAEHSKIRLSTIFEMIRDTIRIRIQLGK